MRHFIGQLLNHRWKDDFFPFAETVKELAKIGISYTSMAECLCRLSKYSVGLKKSSDMYADPQLATPTRTLFHTTVDEISTFVIHPPIPQGGGTPNQSLEYQHKPLNCRRKHKVVIKT
ncbi:hypothetical protein CEXT_162671 [Caerostris extrusa]|uniref:Uncharacterized protein n=1 Tax=Caerostris extrusa TaxID=172846 RepID=A0AAV4QT63_CAEEX|nr:hypothetical protein CEXT_162671 [Caerostris extrusa]